MYLSFIGNHVLSSPVKQSPGKVKVVSLVESKTYESLTNEA